MSQRGDGSGGPRGAGAPRGAWGLGIAQPQVSRTLLRGLSVIRWSEETVR